MRYIEANASRAHLAERAEDWKWSSVATATTSTGKPLLHDGPLDRPRGWVGRLNEPLDEPTLTSIRVSVVKGRPFGDDLWTQRTAHRLGLGFTLRTVGRPKAVK